MKLNKTSGQDSPKHYRSNARRIYKRDFPIGTSVEKSGFSLLSVLLSLFVLSALFTLVQVRFLNTNLLLGKLIKQHEVALGEQAAKNQLTRLVFLSVFREHESHLPELPGLDGTTFAVGVENSEYLFSAQDTAGLIDVNLAPAGLLSLFLEKLAPGRGALLTDAVLQSRQKKPISKVSPFLSELELTGDQIAIARQFLTYNSGERKLNAKTAPTELLRFLSNDAGDKQEMIVSIGRQQFVFRNPEYITLRRLGKNGQ